MNQYRTLLFLTVVLFSCVLLFGCIIFFSIRSLSETKVIFLDVGEGDAILIQSGTTQLLIDSGADGRVLLSRLGRYVPFWDRNIEMILATHSDRDHLGGFASVFRSYRVGNVFTNGERDGTETEKEFFHLAEQEGTRIHALRSGSSFVFSDGGKLSFLWPHPEGVFGKDRSNDGSIVGEYSFGETNFFLTGDLPHEESFLSNIPQTDILKVAHHGSKYSTSEFFLENVSPKEAILSVGKNSYGHPSSEVLTLLDRKNVRVFRTDQDGDIVYVCRDRSCLKR